WPTAGTLPSSVFSECPTVWVGGGPSGYACDLYVTGRLHLKDQGGIPGAINAAGSFAGLEFWGGRDDVTGRDDFVGGNFGIYATSSYFWFVQDKNYSPGGGFDSQVKYLKCWDNGSSGVLDSYVRSESNLQAKGYSIWDEAGSTLTAGSTGTLG